MVLSSQLKTGGDRRREATVGAERRSTVASHCLPNRWPSGLHQSTSAALVADSGSLTICNAAQVTSIHTHEGWRRDGRRETREKRQRTVDSPAACPVTPGRTTGLSPTADKCRRQQLSGVTRCRRRLDLHPAALQDGKVGEAGAGAAAVKWSARREVGRRDANGEQLISQLKPLKIELSKVR